jgi:hypothetical protein
MQVRPKCPLKRGGFRSERDNSRRQQRGAHRCRVGYEKANKQVRKSLCIVIQMTL